MAARACRPDHQERMPDPMNVLIVFSHPEPKSFNGALFDTAVRELRAAGHTVVTSDLLIMQFPMWWFGLPAMLKGWVDRVLAMGRTWQRRHLPDGQVPRQARPAVADHRRTARGLPQGRLQRRHRSHPAPDPARRAAVRRFRRAGAADPLRPGAGEPGTAGRRAVGLCKAIASISNGGADPGRGVRTNRRGGSSAATGRARCRINLTGLTPAHSAWRAQQVSCAVR
jgi:hypothetical protein